MTQEELREYARRLQVVCLSLFDRCEEALYGFGCVTAVFENLLYGVFSRFYAREFSPQAFECLPGFTELGPFLPQFFLGCCALIGHGSQLILLRCRALGKVSR